MCNFCKNAKTEDVYFRPRLTTIYECIMFGNLDACIYLGNGKAIKYEKIIPDNELTNGTIISHCCPICKVENPYIKVIGK